MAITQPAVAEWWCFVGHKFQSVARQLSAVISNENTQSTDINKH